MKKSFLFMLTSLVMLVSSCGGSSSLDDMSLNSPEGLAAIQASMIENFTPYDGKITSVDVLGNKSYNIEVISVGYLEDGKPKLAMYIDGVGLKENDNNLDKKIDHQMFSLKDVDFNKITESVKKASEAILEKDDKFSDFKVEKATFMKNEAREVIFYIGLHATHPGKSYYGKRVMTSNVFNFTVFFDKDGNVKSISDLEV